MSERKGLKRNFSFRKIITITSFILSVFLVVISIWFRPHLVTAILAVIPIFASFYTNCSFNNNTKGVSRYNFLIAENETSSRLIFCMNSKY